MKTQIQIKVENISNDHVHFERIVEVDDSVVIPYGDIVKSLLWLYQGLNIKVCFAQQAPF